MSIGCPKKKSRLCSKFLLKRSICSFSLGPIKISKEISHWVRVFFSAFNSKKGTKTSFRLKMDFSVERVATQPSLFLIT